MGSHATTTFHATSSTRGRVRWREMRCVRCGRLLQKVEENALRPGKHLEIKCGHCKVMNYLVGTEADTAVPVRQEP
jgi:phage FluMu protein Com